MQPLENILIQNTPPPQAETVAQVADLMASTLPTVVYFCVLLSAVGNILWEWYTRTQDYQTRFKEHTDGKRLIDYLVTKGADNE